MKAVRAPALLGPSKRAQPLTEGPLIWTGILALTIFCTAPDVDDSASGSNRLSEVQITSVTGAMNVTARSVDLVWVRDPITLAELPESSASWFARKAELTKRMQDRIDVVELDVHNVVNQSLKLPTRRSYAIAVLAYYESADQADAGAAELTTYECVRIKLAELTTTFDSCNPVEQDSNRPALRLTP
jgi:hypothetical protein